MSEKPQDKGAKLSIVQISTRYNLTRQSVYRAIKRGLLEAAKEDDRWYIYELDYQRYREGKFNRVIRSKWNGEPLYAQDEMSIGQCAKMFGVPEQNLYFLRRQGKLPHERRGHAIVVKYEDCLRLFGDKEKQNLA